MFKGNENVRFQSDNEYNLNKLSICKNYNLEIMDGI